MSIYLVRYVRHSVITCAILILFLREIFEITQYTMQPENEAMLLEALGSDSAERRL